MSRHPQPRGSRGSLRWIQAAVTANSDLLAGPILERFGGNQIAWVSPLESDDFAEYRDSDAFDLLGVKMESRPLESFWPRRGPQWDALGMSNEGVAVLIEAKAHIGELFSAGSGAAGASLALIESSFDEVQRALRATSHVPWTGPLYQYANRLAHLYLLRSLNGVPAVLVNCYFVGDEEMSGPSTPGEWKAALEVVHRVLGLSRHPLGRWMLEVFIDVHELETSEAQ